MNVLSVLKQARKRLAKPGVWAQKMEAVRPGAGHACVAIAIDLASGETALSRCASNALRDAIPLRTHPNLVRWNDKPGRKLSTILNAFDRAIRAEEEKGLHDEQFPDLR